MKMKAIFSSAALVAVTTFLVAPEATAQQTTTPPSIWTEAHTHGFHEWSRGAQAAGLQDRLGTRAHTAFIAGDQAYTQVPATQRQAWETDPAAHRAAMGHTIIEGRLTADELRQRQYVTTIDGARVPVRVEGDNVFVGDARVTRADLAAGESVIHQVDRVTWPQQGQQQMQPAQQQMQPAQQMQPGQQAQPGQQMQPGQQPAMTPQVREPVRKNW
jgi:uncharacterized surface protein with fasciclin (FAS1) repeats